MSAFDCSCPEEEMCVICHHEKKTCCFPLPVGEHTKWCDDDTRGDIEYHRMRDESDLAWLEEADYETLV